MSRRIGNYGTFVPNKKNTSGFKGVSWHKGHKKWQARIHVDGKRKLLGYYNTALEASVAYQFALSQKNDQNFILETKIHHVRRSS